jgi:hypothetical protein
MIDLCLMAQGLVLFGVSSFAALDWKKPQHGSQFCGWVPGINLVA